MTVKNTDGVVLTDTEKQKFLQLKRELTSAYNSLNHSNRTKLREYYEKNLGFIDTALKGDAEVDIETCLLSAEVSVEYLKILDD